MTKNMNVIFALLAVAVVRSATAGGNVAYEDGQVRFTLISPRTVRLEYHPQGKFVDAKSFIAVERDYPEVDYRTSERDGDIEIRTANLVLTYKKGTGAFSAGNLAIVSAQEGVFAWHPGDRDERNLKGTYRTLDGYDGDRRGGEKMPLEDGLLSRSGWTLVDDSQGLVFDDSDWPWVAERPQSESAQDWYFLGYGLDYKQALRDFTLFAGRVPLPPRYAFGYWWSRYWHYGDNDLRELVENFRRYDIPIDVLVIDMDWHYINDGLGAWTGYTFNRRLFPSPKGFMDWVHRQGLKVTMNLHPAEGVRTFEERWPQMAEALGLDKGERKDIEWQGSDKRFMSAWYEVMLRPLERMGVDFWWLDWQQFPNDRRLRRLGNTWWINYATFTDMERNRPDRRALLYHRWGGLGNHRYQVGFSGDSVISWRSLDFQPYFNSTAGNVLYGYWSHDIGGHMHADRIDPELYIRWMQFGAFSPVLRTHTTKVASLNKEPWAFESRYTEILREIIKLRYRLAPYVYTMARRTYDDALPLCRPLYYERPGDEESYAWRNEYYFGDDMLVAPVTAPMQDGRTVKEVWLPRGCEWYEASSGTLLKGGERVVRNFHLDEMPLYIKAGSIVPAYAGDVRNLDGNGEAWVLKVYPSSGPIVRSANIYEDNGNDSGYAANYAVTAVVAEHLEDGTVRVEIAPRRGSYEGMPEMRSVSVRLEGAPPPKSVFVDGESASWSYDGINLAVDIPLPDATPDTARTIIVGFGASPDSRPSTTGGLLGRMKRTRENTLALKCRYAGVIVSEELGVLENTGRLVTYFPERFDEAVKRYNELYERLPEVLRNVDGVKNGHIAQSQIEEFLKATY